MILKSVATVAADGTVTAVAAGVANITVSAEATDKFEAGKVIVPVVVTEKAKAPTVAKPAKVTGVKIANVKGATVKVTVKAYNYKNGNVKQYGAASKTVSKKTDKK